MRVIVAVELDDAGRVTGTCAELLTAARRLGEPVAVVAVPSDSAAVVAQLGAVGATEVFFAEHPLALPGTAAALAEAVGVVARRQAPRAVLAPHTRVGCEVAARVALGLDGALLTDAVAISAGEQIETTHAPLGGTWTTVARPVREPAVITLRPGAETASVIDPVTEPATVRVEISPSPRLVEEVVGVEARGTAGHRPDLRAASVVVSGGRGFGSAAGFEQVGELADELGAAVGASRAAVDAGYAPPTAQVGQSGASVAPQAYLALAISGAMQHEAGMSRSRNIVAVNLDPQAPIFDIADLGVVGDVHQVVPALIAELRSRKESR